MEQVVEQEEKQVTEQPYRRGPFRGLTPNVIRLGIVSFFADVAGEMLYPVVPLFLTALNVPTGTAASFLGVIEGIAEATASIFRTVSGRLSDCSGRRKPFIFGGYLISGLSKAIFVLAISIGWPMVLVARFIDRLGKGIRVAPRDALVGDSVAPEVRGIAFGWHRAFDTAGSALGPVLTLFLLDFLQKTGRPEQSVLSTIFLIAVIPGLLGALCTLTVKERRKAPVCPTAKKPSLAFRTLPPAFRGYLVGWGIFALVNSSDMFLILRAKEVFSAVNFGGNVTYAVILLYTLYNLVYAIISPSLGHLSDKLGRKRVLIAGLFVFALVYGGFAFASQPWHIIALFAVYGLYIAATDGVSKAFAIDLVPQEIRATAVGMISTIAGVCLLFASIIAGQLWKFFGPWAAFGYGAAGAIIAAIVLSRIRAKRIEAEPTTQAA